LPDLALGLRGALSAAGDALDVVERVADETLQGDAVADVQRTPSLGGSERYRGFFR
jgi:hypothetical protein